MKNDLHNLLRKEIKNSIGKSVLYAKDCELLSIEINKKTKRRISGSTIKRFFGLVASEFKPSKYTLDTFSKFLGFNDWNNFVENYLENYQTNADTDTWDKLKNKVQIITNQSLVSLKQKTNYHKKNIFLREFAKKMFKDFMQSPKNALMIAAPHGFGKSSMLIQLIEHFFLNENAKYKNDLVGLLDGELFFSLYAKNNLTQLLYQLINFEINSSIGVHFANHPELLKGRIIGFIDNVDEIFSDKEDYHQLVENISKILITNNQSWFKMVFTCRPENLTPFIYRITKSPVFEACWFNLDFTSENMACAINIPDFESDEIEHVLGKDNAGPDHQDFINRYNNILNIISNPYLLYLFLDVMKYSENDITEINLLNSYVKRKMISKPYYEEKIAIIDRFIELSKLGLEPDTVKKNKLLENRNHVPAYNDLISKGIIYEYIASGNLLENNTYVKFSQNIIFEFLLFEKWRINREMDVDLFFEIRDYYMDKSELQCNLLNFYTRTLIYSGNYYLIKQLHNEFEKRVAPINSPAEIPACLHTISMAVKEIIRNNARFKDEFTPWISKSRLGKLLYC